MYEGVIPIVNVDSSQVVNGVGNVLLGVIDLIKSNPDITLRKLPYRQRGLCRTPLPTSSS
jgi:hypothetical protein